MAGAYQCSQGHRWASDAATAEAAVVVVVCPVCGGPGSADGGDPLPLTIDLPAAAATDSQASAIAATLAEGAFSTRDAPDAVEMTLHFESNGELAGDLPEPLRKRAIVGYELLGEVGRGGMGVVYKARQTALNRIVALKMILAGAHASDRERERFRREAESVAALQHPNIVQIYEIGDSDGHPYLAFEYVEGGSLAQALTGVPLSARTAAELVETLARATHYAHERGIVHRDLKPANVLLATDQHSSTPIENNPNSILVNLCSSVAKITDFGLAKRVADTPPADAEPHGSQTRTGAVVGTPSYIAPEQAAGKNRDVGPPADVYALGAILYELLTGRPPFRGETPLDTVLQVMSEDPVPPSRLQPRVPRDLETICLKCLQKSTAKRYASAAALAADLQRFREGRPIAARPTGLWERGVKWARRHPAATVWLATTGFGLLALLAVSMWFNFALREAAEREQNEAGEARRQAAIADVERGTAEEQRRLAELREKEAARLTALAEERKREAENQARIAHEEFEKSRRSLYALQLTQVAALCERDPRRAQELLDDRRRCPEEFRDFAWHYLKRLCQRLEATFDAPPHGETVSAVAWSPDGRLLASASWDHTVRLWDARSGQLLAVLKGHQGLVAAVAFAPDGQTLATAGDDHAVRLWVVPPEVRWAAMGGRRLRGPPREVAPWRTLNGHGEWVHAVAFSPDGQTLATAGSDRTVRLWDLPALRRRAAEGLVAGAFFTLSPRGADEIREREVLRAHADKVYALAFTPDGRQLVSGGDDRTVRVWSMVDTNDVRILGRFRDGVIALAVAPDGDTVAVVTRGEDASVRLWGMHEGRELARLRGHTRAVYAVAYSADGKLIATGAEDKTVRLWDAETGQERGILKGHDGAVRAVAFAPGRRVVASGGADRKLKVWTTAAPREDGLELEPERNVSAAVASADGRVMVVGDRDGSIKVWQLGGLDDPEGASTPPPLQAGVVAVLPGHAGTVLALALSADGRTLVSGGIDGTIRVWDLRRALIGRPLGRPLVLMQREERRLAGRVGRIRTLALSADGGTLAVGGENGLQLWDARTWRPRQLDSDRTNAVQALAFLNGDRWLVVAGGLNLQVWDVATGAKVQTLAVAHLSAIEAMAVNAAGDLLATGDQDGRITVWDVNLPSVGERGPPDAPKPPLDKNARARMRGHNEAIVELGFTADGRTLLSGSGDRTVRLWDPLAGQERASLTGHGDRVLLVARAGENALVSLDSDGVLRAWRGTPR